MPTTPVNATNPLQPFINTNPGASSATNESADRFLTLLVTQMRNQDPMNPLDNAQVTSQLAQISTVTGLDRLNESFAALASQIEAGQAMQATSLVGRDVMVDGDHLTLVADQPAAGGVMLAAPADQVTVTIKDANGAVVRQIQLGAKPAGIADFTWDGKNDAGAKLPAGRYTISATSTANGTTAAATTLERARVDGLSRASTGFVLSLGSQGFAGLNDIRRIQ